MVDYQLERLSTRSFEQLVQALSLEVIGRDVVIFGDGPDGGREASFNGIVKYPDAHPWDGSGVVQAKFRQEPDSSAKRNADWAIQQVKAEFKNLTPRRLRARAAPRGGRVCPDYYVFATNVALSAAAVAGGKDRVATLFDGYCKTHGLRGYAIWDGDQIRRLLDAHPGIRTTYAAWLMPGDVLTAMMEHLRFKGTDFPATMRRYLESELLDDQYAKLGQGGYTDANAIALSHVFVDLPVAAFPKRAGDGSPLESPIDAELPDGGDFDGEDRETFLRVFLEEGRQVLRPSQQGLEDGTGVDGVPGRIVLVGGPGQGKTTVGQFACQLLRAALLKTTKGPFSPEVRHVLAKIEAESGGLPRVHALRYPLRIDLKRLAEALATPSPAGSTSVLDFLVRHIDKRTESTLDKEDFRRWLKAYPWLLVLDGLDEVPASADRDRMMEAIRNFVAIEAFQLDADLLVLATTRPQGYSEEFNPALYRHLSLLPLTADEAMRYGTRLAEARHPNARSRVEQLVQSLQLATTNPSTVRLMESPLQVTIMLALIEGGGQPPEQRWKLFHDYYDVIYRREKERGTTFSAILGKFEPEIHWIHHRAGWLLQQRNAASGQTAAKLSHKEFESMVDARLRSRGHTDEPRRKALVRQVREAATDRLVLLVGNTAQQIGFEIRSLQEFMAAEHCFDGTEDAVRQTINVIAPFPYWRNVFLFIAGRIFFEKEALIDSLLAVCHRLNNNHADAAQGLLAGGSRLALAMLHDGVSRNQPENALDLTTLAAKLIDQRTRLPAAFRSLFDGETSDVLKTELLARLTDASFRPVAWQLALDLAQGGAASRWALAQLEKHFPWAHPDSARLLLLDPPFYTRQLPERFWNFFSANLHQVPPMFLLRTLSYNVELPLPMPLREQLSSLVAPLRQSGVGLVDDNGNPLANSIGSGGDKLENWTHLQVDHLVRPDGHPHWQLLRAAAEFARKPNLVNLAQQIEQVLRLPHPDMQMGFLPWQFRAAFKAYEAGASVEEIGAGIRAGDLGRSADWVRWGQLSTIKPSRLGYPKGLLSASDAALGAMWSHSSWSHRSGNPFDQIRSAQVVVEAIPKLRAGSDVADTLVQLCCFALSQAGMRGLAGMGAVLDDLIAGYVQAGIAPSREIIVAILQCEFDHERKLAMLDAARVTTDASSWLHEWEEQRIDINAACEKLIQVAISATRGSDSLVPLSFLPPLPFASRIPPAWLKACEEKGGPSRQAAVIFRLNRLDWAVADAAALAHEALQLHEAHRNYLDELVEYVNYSGQRGPHLEAFFVALIGSDLSHQRSGFGTTCGNLLAALVEQRPAVTELPDPAVRRRPVDEQHDAAG